MLPDREQRFALSWGLSMQAAAAMSTACLMPEDDS